MFDKIVLRNSTQPGPTIDPGFLAECLIFYRRVIVVGNAVTVDDLLKSVGPGSLLELLKRGTLEFQFEEDQFLVSSGMREGREYHSLARGGFPDQTIARVAPEKFASIAGPSPIASKADEFASLIRRADYRNFPWEKLYAALADQRFVQDAVKEMIRAIAPRYLLSANPRFRIHREEKGLTVDTNLDFQRLNAEYHQKVPPSHSSLNPAYFIAHLQGAQASLLSAAELDAELGEDSVYAQIHALQIGEVIKRRQRSVNNIETLSNLTLPHARAIREAVNTGSVKFSEVLRLVEHADHFKEWIGRQDPTADFVREYYQATIADTWADKLPSRSTRWIICTGLGLGADALGAGGVGTALGVGISFVDTFFVDRLIRGWRPHHFLSKEVGQLLEHRSSGTAPDESQKQ